MRRRACGPSAGLCLLAEGGGRWTPCRLMLPVSVLSPQNPDIVLVHYLNVPAIEDCGKPCGPILCSINTDKKEWAKWTKEELIGQLKPMCEWPGPRQRRPGGQALRGRGTTCGSPFPSEGSDTGTPLSPDPHAPVRQAGHRTSGAWNR